MSGERRTLWGMVAVGLLVWLVAIPLLQVWLMVTGSLIVAWATFHLLTLGQDAPTARRGVRTRLGTDMSGSERPERGEIGLKIAQPCRSDLPGPFNTI